MPAVLTTNIFSLLKGGKFNIMAIYYTEEFMFEFAKWCNNNYCRVTKGWLTWGYVNNPHFDDEPKPELFTTKELLEEFKKNRNEISE